MADNAYYVDKGQTTPLVVAGLLGVGGIALIVYAIAKGGGAPDPDKGPMRPGETMGDPTSATMQAPGPVNIRRGDRLSVLRPTVGYSGPGRDAFTQFSIRQEQRGQWVTVYASGVAGVHVGPSPQAANWDLVSPNQPQPSGCAAQSLCAFAWPGVEGPVGFFPNPICGAPPQPGPASAYLEVFERVGNISGPFIGPYDPGFASPTCNKRIPVAVKVWPGKIVFV
jgi:hypothetical protein